MLRHSMRLSSVRHTALVIVVAMVICVWILSASPALGASIGFTAAPAPGSQGVERGYFRFDADPGMATRQVLVVTNTTNQEKVLRVAPCDGASAVFGGVAYTDNDNPTKGVGGWIVMPSESVTLPPRASVRVPFEVRVPAETTTGVHVGGISLWEASAATSSTPQSGAGLATKVTVVTRMVITVWVTTPGPAVSAIRIRGVSAQARSDGMYLIVRIASDGTAPASGTGTVVVTAPASGTGTVVVTGDRFKGPLAFGTMVPQSSTDYPVKWKVDPAEGTYEAHVELLYAGGTKVARWTGPFTIGAAQKAAELDRVPGLAKKAADQTLLYVLVGVGLAVLLIAGIVVWVRRRRNSRRVEAQDDFDE